MPSLVDRITEQSAAAVHPAVSGFAAELAQEAGALAVLFYGSNLRTGSLEGVLDYYVLLPGEQREKIWPRVSYREWDHDGVTLRAKIATMAMATFDEAARGELLDTTIWARFVQPSALVWSSDEAACGQVLEAIAQAAQTAARLAVALGQASGSAEDYWRALFRATYQAEFRVEQPGREDSILAVNAAHFDGLLPLALAAQGIAFAQDWSAITPQMAEIERRRILAWWKRRRRMGKTLNILRLIKASTTFDGAARYAAWKIERHTGVPVELTPWRERHPLLAAPGVLWQVWRAQKRTQGRAR
ncbi:hypothetical protein G6N82_08235 [Altererythrobacter sp. BO-6]|uniref:hypothetical protein n=1 Tax=Altererythrobacter sp. BO-6 TaxID=2604537 RepID=UPI0013E0F8A5|nr:hypothetical protein [Altererythrobacter sp. BO-6]QIG54139.1 hypothetical protein G6N82_08235 [Altererythrobacter sp. BO-6]